MIIKINKDKIPYEFKLKSLDRLFTIMIKHFISDNSIYIDVVDEDDYYICKNERLVYGRVVGLYILRDNNNNLSPLMPQAEIVPLSVDGKEYPVTLDTLEDKIFLNYNALYESDNDE